MKATGSAIKDGSELTLPNVGGSFDPVTGAGTLENGGTLQFKSKGHKAKVKKIETTFGAGGAIAAKVGKKNVKRLATVKGGTSSRDDFGGKVSGAQAKLTSKGAKALLGKKSKKTLGTLSTVTVPKTVEVLPQGSAVLEPDSGTTLKFAEKGVNPLTGVEPVAPAVMHVGPPITFEFPITGGSASLDLTDGRINSAGGLKLTKSIPQSAGCDAQHPVGSFIQQTNLSPDLGLQLLIADAATQSGPLVRGGVATMDMSGATSTVDHCDQGGHAHRREAEADQRASATDPEPGRVRNLGRRVRDRRLRLRRRRRPRHLEPDREAALATGGPGGRYAGIRRRAGAWVRSVGRLVEGSVRGRPQSSW